MLGRKDTYFLKKTPNKADSMFVVLCTVVSFIHIRIIVATPTVLV
jgi:hypothetical protein